MTTMTMASLSLMATSPRMKVLRKKRYDFGVVLTPLECPDMKVA